MLIGCIKLANPIYKQCKIHIRPHCCSDRFWFYSGTQLIIHYIIYIINSFKICMKS